MPLARMQRTMSHSPSSLADSYDVIVLGSGSAGASAALASAVGGLSVLVLEKSDRLGGTSAMSGAGTWVPANHVARAAGVEDSPEEALAYLRATAPEGWAATEAGLWRTLAYNSGPMLEFVERHTPLRFDLLDEPDPYIDLPGGKPFGRMLSPRPLRRGVLGRYARYLRRSTMPQIFTYQEGIAHDPYKRPLRAGLRLWPRLLWRFLTDARAQGNALMAGLLRGCLDAGVALRMNAEARRLIIDDLGRVTGVEAVIDGQARRIAARRGVILATGGFEWDPALRARHFPGPMGRISSPRSNTGDGQRMVAEIGGKLDRMDQANISAALPTFYEGRLHGMPVKWQIHPSAILVGRHGRRFGSEFAFDFGERLDARDEAGQARHLPVWVIGDQRYFRATPMLAWYARKDPDFLVTAPSVRELALRAGLDPEALAETVRRWNGFAAAGRDADFARGESPFERYRGGGKTDARQTLGPIDRPPYVALRYDRPILGTKGGARTNEKCQVLREDGSLIAGLYFVGIGMASPIGTRPISAGTTIGPNMTFGYTAAQAILQQNS